MAIRLRVQSMIGLPLVRQRGVERVQRQLHKAQCRVRVRVMTVNVSALNSSRQRQKKKRQGKFP
jgi:hypothetical protein